MYVVIISENVLLSDCKYSRFSQNVRVQNKLGNITNYSAVLKSALLIVKVKFIRLAGLCFWNSFD
jgi:hypothetical protein